MLLRDKRYVTTDMCSLCKQSVK